MPEHNCEFGSAFPVRFLPLESVKLYDSEGNEVLCKCGKPASTAIMGKEAFIARCNECMYGA
jgi:hypothetical protein